MAVAGPWVKIRLPSACRIRPNVAVENCEREPARSVPRPIRGRPLARRRGSVERWTEWPAVVEPSCVWALDGPTVG